MSITIINDLHLGVKRQAGTSNDSRIALRNYMFDQFRRLLNQANADLVILGDLFDSFQVNKSDEIAVFECLTEWLANHTYSKLYLVAGNHDLSKNSNNISSFENLCVYLKHTAFGDRVIQVQGRHENINTYTIAVPHLPTQEMFDNELNEILKLPDAPTFVLVHCNYDNHFAEEADHSLNISKEVAQKFAAKNIELVFAHEHQQRDEANCHIIGNQIPSSIADCLGNSNKRYAVIRQEHLSYQPFLSISDVYEDLNWIEALSSNKQFVRISGTAEFNQAAAVIDTIADLRRKSQAFIITNAVRVGSLEVSATEAPSLKTFDVQQMVENELPEDLKARFKEVTQTAKELNND